MINITKNIDSIHLITCTLCPRMFLKNTLQCADVLFIAWLVKLHVETVFFSTEDMLIFLNFKFYLDNIISSNDFPHLAKISGRVPSV